MIVIRSSLFLERLLVSEGRALSLWSGFDVTSALAKRTTNTKRRLISSNVSMSVISYTPCITTIASLLYFCIRRKINNWFISNASHSTGNIDVARLFETSGSGKRIVRLSSRTFISSCALTMLATRMNNNGENMLSIPVYDASWRFAPFEIIPETQWVLRPFCVSQLPRFIPSELNSALVS